MRHSQAQRGVLVSQSRREESLGVRELAELLLTLVSHLATGRENHLQVRLQQSSPTAICYGVLSPSLQSSCADIVDGMPYDFTLKRFGPSDDPRATVKLPLTLTSCTLIPCLSAVPTFWHSHTPSPQPPVGESISPINTDTPYRRRPLRNDHFHPRRLRRSEVV